MPEESSFNSYPPHWKVSDRFLEMSSPWFTLIGEKLIDHQNNLLDYWRVERADSVIVLPLWQSSLLLPVAVYRPGVGQATWDFPGGRIPPGETAIATAPKILEKELGVPLEAIEQLTPLNQEGWMVNSSFSDQRLYGVLATLVSDFSPDPSYLGASYPITQSGISELRQQLTCLQCRALLVEWWMEQRA